MNLYIDQIRPALKEEWDSVWRRCRFATYFHSREWAEIWSHYKKGKYKPNPLLVMFNDGNEALLPLSGIMSGDSIWGFVTSPGPGVNYGGWIADGPIGREHAILMKEFLTKGIGSHLYWYINPFDSLITETRVDAKKLDETLTVNLERGFHAVIRGWSSACRRAERKARKSDILVKIAKTEEEWREYYLVYKDSLKRWGDQFYKECLRRWGKKAERQVAWALFQEMFDSNSDHIKLWLAMTNAGNIAAGALMLYANKHVLYFLGAAMEDYFHLRPMNLLFSEIMRDACKKGYHWFDFGPSWGIEGVHRFKKSFGATPLDYSMVHVELQNS